MAKTSDAIFDILRRYTDVVFFVPGGQAAHLVDSLGKSGLRRVSALHEQGAAFMACGYAMATGKLGVCLTTSGPGAVNAIAGCAAAWMDSIPVLFISGQANSWSLIGDTGLRVRGVQEVDIVPMVENIVKDWCRPVRTSGDKYIMIAVERMIKGCLSDRCGPAWLDVPLDLQAEEL
jgi:acetolactate synthase-1/2/3 large subunit